MPSTEAYLGRPAQDSAGHWHVDLDSGLRANFEQICLLSSTIFDARSCAIVARFPECVVELARAGDAPSLTDDSLRQLVDSDDALRDPGAPAKQPPLAVNGDRFASVITMPSGHHLGWLVLQCSRENGLNAKEEQILTVLNRDVVNHLAQSKKVFEDAKAQGLQTLISEHNEDWIFVKDEHFRIVYANDAFLGVYPEDMRDQVIGYTTVEEYDETEADLFLAQDRVAFETGLSRVTEELHMPDGRHRIVDTVKRRFEDANGKRYILGICRNITEREELIRELKKVNDDLAYFTSVASHDLKSPLNAIRRLLEWIEEDCLDLLPDEHRENIRLVVNRADRMHALLDDLLTYARIGKESAAVEDIHLPTLFGDIEQLLDIPATTTFDVPDATLRVPAVPFKTVMLNLVGNATKHNDKLEGLVTIGFKETRHYYRIVVRDNGPGIAPQYFDKIFQLFQTLKPRDEVEGSGIGLSVVMKYVTNAGGTVDVDSDGSTYSAFTINWPRGGR